jgi:hypothetical protein
MSRAWLIDVLDRELPDMIGADRDRIADAILDALPLPQIAAAVKTSALAAMLVSNIGKNNQHRHMIAADIANNGAMAVLAVLGDADVDTEIEDVPEGSSVQ